MKKLLNKLLAYHIAFWTFDRWYRRAWMIGPPAVAATALALVMIPGTSGNTAPGTAQWAKPSGGQQSGETADPDLKLCMDAKANHVPRAAACDRVIKKGGLADSVLADAYHNRGWSRWIAKDQPAAVADFTEAIRLNPKDANAYNNRGAISLERGELEPALKDFDAAIRLLPGNAVVLANKAEVLRRQGKLADAQGEVKKALDADRNNARAKSIQDLILADLKKMEETQRAGPDLSLCKNAQAEIKARGAACDRLIKQGGFSAGIMSEAYFGRAWMRENGGDVAGAVVDYSETIRLEPTGATPFNNRGGLLLRRGELNDALRDFDEAIKLNPRYALAIANRAEVLRQQGKLAEAQAEITKALGIEANSARAKHVQGLIVADQQKKPEPKQTPLPQQDPATEALRKRANEHIRNKDYDSAIADMTEVIRKEGATWEDFNTRGRAYHGKGQYGPALADYDRAVSRANHGAAAHYNRALIHERTGDLPKAETELMAAIQQHSASTPNYLIMLGRVTSNQSNHERAIMAYGALLEVYDKDKSTTPSQKAEAFFLRGRAKKNQVMAERSRCPTLTGQDTNCMSASRFAEAVLDLETALTFAPNYADAHFDKGVIAAEIGNTKGAIDAYTAAINASPTFSMAYNNRGVQYGKLNEPELAFRDYNDAIRHDTNNKFAWANRGVQFVNARQRQKGIDDLRKALAIDPNYAFAIKQLQALGGVRR